MRTSVDFKGAVKLLLFRESSFAKFLSLMMIVMAVLWPAGERSVHAADTSELRLLFIGNSLTYSNDLPAIIQAMAKSGKQRKVRFEMVAYPDFSLEDHWRRGDALRAIQKTKSDMVVLQQGPSALTDGRASLFRYAKMFADSIRGTGAKPALYSVWPSKMRKHDLEQSIESYRTAAESVEGIFIPVGDAWRIAWQLKPDVELYAPDGLHPSKNGSYLAGLVFYEILFGKSSAGLPSKLKLSSNRIRTIEIEDPVAKILQTAASTAVQKAINK